MPSAPKYTIQQITDALRKCGGLRSHAAQRLGCVPSTVTNYISRHDELKEIEAQCVKDQLDIAESKLFQHIEDGNIPALLFYLKCKGKARGYVEREQGISLEAFRRALESLAVVVAENVKDEDTLDRIERGWESIRMS